MSMIRRNTNRNDYFLIMRPEVSGPCVGFKIEIQLMIRKLHKTLLKK